jgi:hypothetical protein
MDRSAQVTSIDAIRAFRTALVKFDADARDAVTLLVLEVRKALDWLEHDRPRYWAEQLRKASEWVVQARNELDRCQLTYGSEDRPSCYEQKKALEKAKRRLRLCEEKVKTVRRWLRTVHSQMNEFNGQIARMNNCLDTDIARAVAALERMVRALEKYVEASVPESRASTAAAEGAETGPGTPNGGAPPIPAEHVP